MLKLFQEFDRHASRFRVPPFDETLDTQEVLPMLPATSRLRNTTIVGMVTEVGHAFAPECGDSPRGTYNLPRPGSIARARSDHRPTQRTSKLPGPPLPRRPPAPASVATGGALDSVCGARSVQIRTMRSVLESNEEVLQPGLV